MHHLVHVHGPHEPLNLLFFAHNLLFMLQAIEILTGCYVLVQVNSFVALYFIQSSFLIFPHFICRTKCDNFIYDGQGNTVASMGSFKGLKQVRRIVEDCILNVMHPVHNIKVEI